MNTVAGSSRSSSNAAQGTVASDSASAFSQAVSPSTGQRELPLQIPDSPAPHGYLANPYRQVAEEAHAELNRQLEAIDEAQWQNAIADDGVAILISMRDPSEADKVPAAKGRSFIPNCRPIEILACIHLFSYRLIWDTRMSSGRILQRYNHHSFLFYSVWRGVGLIYSQRDAVGVQDVRCWGPHGERQALVLPNTEKIDVVWRSVVTPEVPPQEGKVRMRVDLGAYRIVWRPQMNGCEVTFVSEAALGASIPTYLWKVLSMELPRIVGRLRGSIQRFGIPPYVLDLQDCVVIQTTFYFGETRKTTHRHHVRKPGSYSIMIDRFRMFPFGISPPAVFGAGAHAVSLQEVEDRIIVTVGASGVGQEFVIEIEPREKETETESTTGWW